MNRFNAIIRKNTTAARLLLMGCLTLGEASFAKGVVIVPDSTMVQRAVTLGDLLKGQVAGLHVRSSDGAPGGAYQIQIRGGGMGRTEMPPLIILDGVQLNPMTFEPLNAWANIDQHDYQAVQSILNGIQVQDIASIEIIKEPSELAAYGSKGANGVILLRSKNGEEKGRSITLTTNVGIATPTTSDRTFQSNELLHNHYLNLQGNVKRTRYLISGWAGWQNGTIKRSGKQELGINARLEQAVNDKIKLGASLSFSNTQTSMIQAVSQIGGSSLTTQIHAQQGETAQSWLNDYDDHTAQWRVVPQAFFEYRPSKEVIVRLDGGLDYLNQTRFRWMGTQIARGAVDNSRAGRSESLGVAYNIAPSLSLNKQFGKAHRLTIDVKGEYRGGDESHLSNYGLDYSVPYLRAKGIRFGAQSGSSSYYDQSGSSLSGLVKAGYTFGEIVSVKAGLRAEWLLKFNDREPQYYPFAGASVSLLDNGRGVFKQPSGILDRLTVCLDWGQTGYDLGRTYMQIPEQQRYIANPINIPELKKLYYAPRFTYRNSEWSVGLNAELWKGRLQLAATYYRGEGNDRFSIYSFHPDTTRTVVGSMGQDSLVNGTIHNPQLSTLSRFVRQGVELDVKARVVQNSQWIVDLGFNAAWQEAQTSETDKDNKEGHLPYLFYGYRTESDTELSVIGNSMPSFVYGLNANMQYNRWQLDLRFDGVHGNQVLNMNRYVGRITSDLVECGGFFRLSTLSLGYRFDVRKIKWLGELGLNVMASNLFSISNYSGYSSDVNVYTFDRYRQGWDYGAYPPSRNFSIGLIAKF